MGLPQAFTCPVRVYYEDTDAAGVVYYANYFRYLERARTEWLDAIGQPLEELQRIHGVVFVVRRLEADFHLPARLFDRLGVSVEIVSAGHASLVLRQAVRRGDEMLVDARVKLASIAAGSFRPVRIPSTLAARIAGGATMSLP